MKKIKNWLITQVANRRFQGTAAYWEKRYASGGHSGAGSYDKLADFKATVVNSFIKKNQVTSVVEFGCGDGNQLALGEYPKYIGLDVSKSSIRICAEKHAKDPHKNFFIYDSQAFIDNSGIFKSDLAMSLDVIYHIIEDEAFSSYMHHLFNSAKTYVIIYSTDFDSKQTFHVKHRNFTKWIETNLPAWKLMETIKNQHPHDPSDVYTSNADFFIYKTVDMNAFPDAELARSRNVLL